VHKTKQIEGNKKNHLRRTGNKYTQETNETETETGGTWFFSVEKDTRDDHING